MQPFIQIYVPRTTALITMIKPVDMWLYIVNNKGWMVASMVWLLMICHFTWQWSHMSVMASEIAGNSAICSRVFFNPITTNIWNIPIPGFFVRVSSVLTSKWASNAESVSMSSRHQEPLNGRSTHICRADSRLAPSHWKTVLLCNDVFHWLPGSKPRISAAYMGGDLGHAASVVLLACRKCHTINRHAADSTLANHTVSLVMNEFLAKVLLIRRQFVKYHPSRDVL